MTAAHARALQQAMSQLSNSSSSHLKAVLGCDKLCACVDAQWCCLVMVVEVVVEMVVSAVAAAPVVKKGG